MLEVRYKTADFRPRVIRALAAPVPEVGGARNFQQVFSNDWRIFVPSLKSIAAIVLKICAIKKIFFGKCAKWALFSNPLTNKKNPWIMTWSPEQVAKMFQFTIGSEAYTVKQYFYAHDKFIPINFIKMGLLINLCGFYLCILASCLIHCKVWCNKKFMWYKFVHPVLDSHNSHK